MLNQDCRTVRDRLTRALAAASDAEITAHLESCSACAAYARRLTVAREVLAVPAAPPDAMEPSPSFAVRVVARLPKTTEVLGWAALRALPAALVLVMALLWIGVAQPPEPRDLWTDAPTPDAVLTYAALAPEAGP
jgi:predicted anti-sigma-YlaC factor YlaD